MNLTKTIVSTWTAWVAIALFAVMGLWWISLNPFVPSSAENVVHARYVWGSSYQLVALWGALCGLAISRLWGGWRSVIGRSILAFSIGLLLRVG